MGLLGAIVDYYDSSSDPKLVELRTALGTGKLWADILPADIELPWGAISESGASLAEENKSGKIRVVDQRIAFDIFSNRRAEVDDILDLLEEAFLPNPGLILSLGETRTHLATYFANRVSFYDNELWHGSLELAFRVKKITTAA